MTPKIIELKETPLVLVEFPEGAICPSYGRSGIGYILNGCLVINSELKGDHDFIGILSDLTEEQFAGCVMVFNQINGDIVYLNYTMGTDEYSAKDSFYSLLESENVYTENPHNYILISTEENFENGKCDKIELQIVKDRWQEAQSRTIDPTRTIVLIRKED